MSSIDSAYSLTHADATLLPPVCKHGTVEEPQPAREGGLQAELPVLDRLVDEAAERDEALASHGEGLGIDEAPAQELGDAGPPAQAADVAHRDHGSERPADGVDLDAVAEHQVD